MAKDRFDYKPDDILNPRGQNGMSARAAFYQRSLYQQKVYPPDFPSPLDTWYNKLIYGRVDQFQNSVVPGLGNFKTIPSAAMPNMRALNVVVDIFEKFVAHMAKAVLVSAVDPRGNSNLLNIKAHRAYESPNASYAQHVQRLYNAYLDRMSHRERKGIRDFGTFLQFYRHYLLDTASHVPITKTNYLLTSNCNIFNSGVCIAVANKDAGSDFVKNQEFLTDPNFEFYRKCAKKFGFMIDKNIPWVLTADMFTTAFEQAALTRYTAGGTHISRENFFDVFYDKTYLTDFDDLKYMFINSYIGLVNREPFYEDDTRGLRDRGLPAAGVGRIASDCAVVSRPRTPLVEETPALLPTITDPASAEHTGAFPAQEGGAMQVIAPQDVRATLGGADVLTDRFLIDFYVDLRQAEVGGVLAPHRVKTLKTQCYEIYTLRPNPAITPLQNVAAYVNTIYRNYIYDIGAVALQEENAKVLDNRVTGDRILVENGTNRQLY